MPDTEYRIEPSVDTYDFTPSIDSEGIIDYTGVHPDKIYLANRKTVLAEDYPSYLPPVHIRRGRSYDIPAYKEAENTYLIRESDETHTDEKGSIVNPRIYRVSLDVYAALVNYHLEFDRAAFSSVAKYNEEHRLAAISTGSKEYEAIREKDIPILPGKFDPENVKERFTQRFVHVENKPSRVSLARTESRRMGYEPFYFIRDMGIELGRKTGRSEIFTMHRECLTDVTQKMLDMELQKADWESTWTKGRETSYGDTGLDDSLYEQFGVMVKRQNGDKITSTEIDDIKASIEQVYSVFGDVSEASRSFGLKLSHAGDVRMHASKYVGIFSPYYKAIGVSFKNGSTEAGLTAVHEYAHFLDHLSGKELNAWHASDIQGSFENQIAVEFRGQMNEAKGAYWTRTCECFARAIEEYAHISQLREQDGIDGFSFSSIEAVNKEVSKPAYVNYLAFQENIEPLINNLIEHYRERFANVNEQQSILMGTKPHEDMVVEAETKKSAIATADLSIDELRRRIYQLASEKNKLDKEARRLSDEKSAERHHLLDAEASRLAHDVTEIDRQLLILSSTEGQSARITELEVSRVNLIEQRNTLHASFTPKSDTLSSLIQEEADIERRLDAIEVDGRALTLILMDREENEKLVQKKELDIKIAVSTFKQLELFEPGDSYVGDDADKYYVGDLFTEGDGALNREHIREAKAAARSYSLPILDGERTGLWTKFRDFEKHGVFDIQGAKVATDTDGNITDAGWEQLNQALQIYRDKRFETFRVLFISPEGEVKDQVLVSSRFPNRVYLGPLFGLGIEQIVNQAVETNTRIIVAHNHPSGNIEPSEEDKNITERLKKELIDKEGNSLFIGHIILDHNMFGLYRSDEWYSILGKAQEKDPLLTEELPDFTQISIVSPGALKTVADSINENDRWNVNDWVPVLFTDAKSCVSGVSCYSRDWFINKQSEEIVEEFRVVGLSTGATKAFPILSGENAHDSELIKSVQEHYGNGCFLDYYIEGMSPADYRSISFGRGIFEDFSPEETFDRTKVESTNGIEKTFKTLDEYLENVSAPEEFYSNGGISPFQVRTSPNLFREIEGLSRSDIGKVNSFITISDKTPLVLTLNGLPDKQINMYRDKISRALFLDPAMMGHRATHGHADSIDKGLIHRVFTSLANPYYIFASKDTKSLVGVYDIADRNGEPVIVTFRHSNDHNTVEANWITSLYGKNEAGIERWAEEGLLRYVNDKEKATELTFTLQMRVKDNSAAYNKNIRYKSAVVNSILDGSLEVRSPDQYYDLFSPDEITTEPINHRPVGQYELVFIENDVFSVDIEDGYVYLRGADGTVQFGVTTDNVNLPTPAELTESYLKSKNEEISLTEALNASYYNIEETETKEKEYDDGRSEPEEPDASRPSEATSIREIPEGRGLQLDDLFHPAGYTGIQERSDVLQSEGRADLRADRYSPFNEELSEGARLDDRNGSGGIRPASMPEGEVGSDREELSVGTRESRNGDVSTRSLRDIRSECISILATKTDQEITDDDRLILARYEGAGGLNDKNATAAGVLSEFYTPEPVIKKVWQLVDSYAPGAKTVMEPSAGTGRFAVGRENNSFTFHELDGTSSRIAKILHPEANVIPGAFQKQFFDSMGRVLKKNYIPPTYDVVIGNPPYGAYSGTWKGMGEGKHHNRYEEYFIEKGLDSLKQDGILAFIVPSSFLRSKNDSVKELIASKGVLLDAWRLPNGVFPTTDVGTDIIVMRSGVSEGEQLSNDTYFLRNPDHVLGIESERSGRFGPEKYVAFAEGKDVEQTLEGIVPTQSLIQDSENERDQFVQQNEEPDENEVHSTQTDLSQINRRNQSKLQERTGQATQDKESTVKGKILSSEDFSARYGKEYDPRGFPIWAATSWNGSIDLSKLTDESKGYLASSPDYVEETPGVWVHKILYASGNIIKKINDLEYLHEGGGIPDELYGRNISILVDSLPKAIPLTDIQFSPMTSIASDFKVKNERGEELSLKEGFIDWVVGNSNEGMYDYYRRRNFDPAVSPLNQEDIPPSIRWSDIVEYLDGEPVRADRSYNDESRKANRIEAENKRIERREAADKLFNRYLQEGLSDVDSTRLEEEWNGRFNNNVNPDYSHLPLFVEGMSEFKGDEPFTLYDQQIKGVSFLANKGNGLLAYDVGVGKTAAGIVATVNQIQTERAKRPLVVVPKSVYSKWTRDFKELFPNIAINELGNFSDKYLKSYRNDENGLNIPENSISVCTIEALQSISFTDASISGPLFEDFSNLLGISDTDGSERERKINEEKISESVGRASQTKDGFVFWEKTGFDHVTVDEAHRFKNLFKTPRSSEKGSANEYSGLGAGNPSARALKLFGITQLIQRENENRNVFLLTATPFTNSPLEVYSMLSYMGRERLKEMHLYNLRSFLDEFAEMKNEWAVDAKGSIQTR